MAVNEKGRFWRICRIYFRRFRITVLLLILFLVAGVAYLNLVGLPGFIKKPLLNRLRTRGVELKFSRLRLLWNRGIVAENVQFGRAHTAGGPKLTAEEVDVGIHYAALAHFQFQVNSLDLQHGRFQWMLVGTNLPARALIISNIQARLLFHTNDRWALKNFQAGFAGARFRLAAVITNASAIRTWQSPHRKTLTKPGALRRNLRALANTLDQIHFSTPPQIILQARGDACIPQSFNVMMSVEARGADTAWGNASEAQLTAHLSPVADSTNLLRGHVTVLAHQLETKWATVSNATLTAEWAQTLTNTVPLSGNAELGLEAAHSRWGDVREARLDTKLVATATNSPRQGDESWAWWTNLAPYALDYHCQLAGLKTPKLEVSKMRCAGRWRAPEFTITNLNTSLYDGGLLGHIALNVASRDFHFGCTSDFDPKKISPLLTQMAREWLSQFTWEKPPALYAEGSLVLPPWTRRHPDWRDNVRPTVRLQGRFRVENGTYRDVPATAAESDFTYSNLVWYLPDLRVSRPEGQLILVHRSNEANHEYYFHIQSTIDLRVLRPLLEPREQQELDLVTFTRPPTVNGEVWGRWHEEDRTGARLWLAATNFTFRGQAISNFQTQLEYTNHIVKLVAPHAERGPETADASLVVVNFDKDKVFLTNGWSTADPQLVAELIGPEIGKEFAPYKFLDPPKAHVNGTIPLHGVRGANLVFDVDGGPFHWWKFTLPNITGQVHWLGNALFLNHVHASFYGGTADGHAAFDFSPHEGTDLRFDTAVTNTNLRLLMADLFTNTNKLEGSLTGKLEVTSANSEHWDSWQGYGHMNLRDGLIWEIPIFGVLSPALNSIVPGLGSSRLSDGSASFIITNSIIQSDNLELQSPAMRLQYRGRVDFHGNVNAHVDAELLRDMWVVGRAVSTVLWPVSKLFEYHVTGTLAAPKTEPVYVLPKLLSIPLHPFRTLKALLPPIRGANSSGSAFTNAPPSTP